MKRVKFKTIILTLVVSIFCVFGVCACVSDEILQPVVSVSPYAPIALNENVVAMPQYYVSPLGSDDNIGTKDSPMRTIDYALMAVKRFKNEINSNIKIVLADGYHVLRKNLTLDETINLPNNYKLSIVAESGASPIISGGLPVYGWDSCVVNGIKMIKAKVEGVSSVRQFYVNEEPRELANFDEKISWAWGGKGAEIKRSEIKTYGSNFNPAALYNVKQLEFVWQEEWRSFIYRTVANNDNVFKMQDEFERVNSMTRYIPSLEYTQPDPNHDDLEMQNDVSFIDKKGEFCYDESEEYLYYYPLDGENVYASTCFVPRLDTFVSIKGNETERVKNVSFSGITFAHGQADFIALEGMNILQAQQLVVSDTDSTQNYERGTIHGGVEVDYAENINFMNSKFINSAAIGLRFRSNVKNCSVVGNKFINLGDSSMVAGVGEVYSGNMPENIVFSNNVVRNIGRINKSAPAVTLYQTKKSTVTHNDIYDVPYTGISSGWGWGNAPGNYRSEYNNFSFNRVGNYLKYMSDGGGIYTLDKNYGSIVEGNYFYEMRGKGFSIYHDEGSRNITTKNNVVSIEKEYQNSNLFWLCINNMWAESQGISSGDITVSNNYYNYDNMRDRGENDTFINNTLVSGEWNDQAKAIIEKAGLTSDYAHLLKK